jgi:putative restriction endonuclease
MNANSLLTESLHNAPPAAPSEMKYWWVNQNQTYSEEISGDFLWSPKTKSNGVRSQSYDFMTDVRAGDVVFSFCDTLIKAVGIATGSATGVPKPNFDKASASWSDDGWRIPVEFTELARTVRPKDHINKIRKHLPTRYSPLQQNGNGLQSIYLTHVPTEMAAILRGLIGQEYDVIVKFIPDGAQQAICDNLEDAIIGRTDIGPTMKEQLVKSRRGQGLFKINVRRNEKACRVTGVSDPRSLRASHIKPWKDCSDIERLNGCNGLLLAPHIDYLFDAGLISFSDNGDLLISPLLDRTILSRWGIQEVLNVGSLKKQAYFLAYHLKSVLKR